MEDAPAPGSADPVTSGRPDPVDRYPSVHRRSHQWRSRRANGIAALALIGALVLVVLLLALFA